MDTTRTPEQLKAMEGTPDDLKTVGEEGFEGHERREAAIRDVDRVFAEYIIQNQVLVANSSKLMSIWLGNKQTQTYPKNYLQHNIARAAVHNNRGTKKGFYEKVDENTFLVCIIDETGNLYS